MADIELVIKISEETLNEIKDNAMFAKNIAYNIKRDVTGAIVNGTLVPDNATNRDVIDIMFPDGFSAKKSWWDARYTGRMIK